MEALLVACPRNISHIFSPDTKLLSGDLLFSRIRVSILYGLPPRSREKKFTMQNVFFSAQITNHIQYSVRSISGFSYLQHILSGSHSCLFSDIPIITGWFAPDCKAVKIVRASFQHYQISYCNNDDDNNNNNNSIFHC